MGNKTVTVSWNEHEVLVSDAEWVETMAKLWGMTSREIKFGRDGFRREVYKGYRGREFADAISDLETIFIESVR